MPAFQFRRSSSIQARSSAICGPGSRMPTSSSTAVAPARKASILLVFQLSIGPPQFRPHQYPLLRAQAISPIILKALIGQAAELTADRSRHRLPSSLRSTWPDRVSDLQAGARPSVQPQPSPRYHAQRLEPLPLPYVNRGMPLAASRCYPPPAITVEAVLSCEGRPLSCQRAITPARITQQPSAAIPIRNLRLRRASARIPAEVSPMPTTIDAISARGLPPSILRLLSCSWLIEVQIRNNMPHTAKQATLTNRRSLMI